MNRLTPDAEQIFKEKDYESSIKRNFDRTAGPRSVDLPQKPPKRGLATFKSVGRKEKSNILQIEGSEIPYFILQDDY